MLNEAKDSLADPNFEILKKNDPWERSILNYRRQITRERGGQNVTKAWLKMYEILTQTWVGPYLLGIANIGEPVDCFFNAELPGGFIYAVNHYLKTNFRSFEWVIASYYPQNTQGKNFLTDEFALITKYPQYSLVGIVPINQKQFWCDGDLTNPEMPTNLSSLAVSRLYPIDLYTADGGFDVQGQDNHQEELTLPLIRGEVECGLLSLNPGGVMIIKIFTFFTPQMWTMLVYLMRLFRNYDIFKPQTSGPLNSESYFIGIGYSGISPDDLKTIRKDARNPDTRYAVPTEAENIYLLEKMIELTNNQIFNIKKFLAGNSSESKVSLEIDLLPFKDRL